MDNLVHKFVLLWAVIDPIGTIPVFIAVTAALKTTAEKNKVAIKAIVIAALVLVFFVVLGEILLDAMDIPLPAFQVAGGVVLFLFALTMIFGDSKPEQELGLVDKAHNAAVFPLAIPSIASPGAMMAAVLLTDNHRFSLVEQTITTGIILVILLITLVLMLAANKIVKLIGETGASVISRVMGLILSAVAMNAVLSGLFTYYSSVNG
ncbi:MarC family protein [Catenovulum agarivorans]|uniref:MarC family protein n=1 Tax=Catenovulum agarivorans TaxID=1172192 RepID=UPI0002E45912|nr:MarC family protein [Catenovulum agarivorans]